MAVHSHEGYPSPHRRIWLPGRNRQGRAGSASLDRAAEILADPQQFADTHSYALRGDQFMPTVTYRGARETIHVGDGAHRRSGTLLLARPHATDDVAALLIGGIEDHRLVVEQYVANSFRSGHYLVRDYVRSLLPRGKVLSIEVDSYDWVKQVATSPDDRLSRANLAEADQAVLAQLTPEQQTEMTQAAAILHAIQAYRQAATAP